MASSSATVVAAGETNIFPETVTGSHVLNVKGYNETMGFLGAGKFVASSTFTVGGHNWRVLYYPDGRHVDYSDYISVYLDRLLDCPGDDDSTVMARCKFSLLVDETSEPWHIKETQVLRPFVGKDNDAWGFHEFILREDLESSIHFKNGCLRIRCDVTIIKNICTEVNNTTMKQPAVPPSHLHRHLGNLLKTNSKVRGDVKFKVGRNKFRAHRNVLAMRSPVLMAELFGKMKEKKAAFVRIRDMEPRVFEAFLHFIYTDALPEIDEGDKMAMAQHLLVVADRYHMERLKLICEVLLHGYISKDTAATMALLAEQHACHGLKQVCLRFMASPCNMKAVMASEGFEYLTRSCPSLLKELADNIEV